MAGLTRTLLVFMVSVALWPNPASAQPPQHDPTDAALVISEFVASNNRSLRDSDGGARLQIVRGEFRGGLLHIDVRRVAGAQEGTGNQQRQGDRDCPLHTILANLHNVFHQTNM